MKKTMIAASLFVAALVWPVQAGNDPEIIARIGPATSTGEVTLSGVSNRKNCVTNIDVISDSAYTFRMLNGGTTVYAMTLAANTGLVRSWDLEDAVCGSSNTNVVLKISAGTYQINYIGYTY